MRKSSWPVWLLFLFFCFMLPVRSFAQDSSSVLNRILSFPDKVFGRIDKEANKFEQKLTQQTDKYLNKLQKQEEKLKRRLWRTDSTKAKEVFGDVQGRYDVLRDQVHGKANSMQLHTAAYNGHLDSLGTAMNFLQNNLELQQVTAIKDKLGNNLQSINDLKSKLNQTENIRKQILQRQQELKAKLQNTGLAKEFQKFKKEVYYYQAQVREYQDALKDPKKLGAKMLQVANKVPAFQDFFRRNSELASLFRLPGGTDPVNSTASFAGLQTRASVQNLLLQRLGTGPDAQQYMQQQMQGAQSQMKELKNKLQQYKQGSYGNGDGEMPDFKVNEQKTKTFLQRIEWGSNMQTTKGNFYFPVTSDIGLSAGYKLNDKSIIGIGASYKMGMGSIQRISISHQGIGLRSFVDWKLKKQFYITGGFEMNYNASFKNIEQLQKYNSWQQAGLIGLSKKIKLKTKYVKGTNFQVLYDFLFKTHVVPTQPVVFRVGYNF